MTRREVKISLQGLLIAAILIVACASSADAQARGNSTVDATKSGHAEETQAADAFEAELRAKRELRYAEKQYRENLDRADLLSDLGAELAESFKRKNSLDRDDFKKLDKLEKLTKGVRGAAGGSEDEVETEKPCNDLPSLMKKLAKTAEALKESVHKTPRRVISAEVIDQANELIELIRSVRLHSSGANS